VTEVVTGEAVVLEVPCARFPSRVLALAIDLAIQLVIISVLLTIVVLGAANHGMNTAAVTAIVITVIVLALIGYPVVWEAATRGRTPGKFALGLRVVGDDGSPERFRQALVRGLATLVDFWLVPFIGVPALVCSLLSARGKRLGDVFAGTFVIQQRLPARRGAAAPPVPPELAAWASGLELSGLTDQTAAMARLYLGRLPDLTPGARAELGERIYAAVRAQVSPPPPSGTPAPPYLAAVLAERYRREHARLMAPGAPGAMPYPAPPGAGRGAATPGAARPRWAPPGTTTPPWASPGAPVSRPEPASRWAAPEPARSPAPEWMGTPGAGEDAQPVQHDRPHDHGQAGQPGRPVQPDEPPSPAAAGTGFVPPQ
jgi:uncharacterized RDD family membrane protein YckC